MPTVISHLTNVSSFITSALHRQSFRRATCLTVTLVSGFALLALNGGTRKAESRNAVTVRAAGRGKPFFNFADGRQVTTAYRGNSTATHFLQSGQARPRAMATAVLGADAVPNLISGYSSGGMGVVTVQHGNPEAFAPKDESVYSRIQQGYNPDPLLPATDTYLVPQSADFLQVGDFNHDGRKDVLTAARGGDLFLLAGDGGGGLDAALLIPLPGKVTAVTAGEFRVIDGWTDLAVSVDTPSGPMLLIFDGASALSGELTSFPLKAAATAMQFADLDHDPFQDLVLAAGDQVIIIHGWSRKGADDPNSRVERTRVGHEVRDLAVGFFIWNREANNQIAVLSADGDVRILDRGSDTRPYTPEEAALFHRRNIHKTSDSVDVELLPGWQRSQAGNWKSVRQVSSGASLAADARSQKVLSRGKISFQETDELFMVDRSNRRLGIVRQGGGTDIIRPGKDKSGAQSNVTSQTGDLTTTSLDTAEGATAVQEFPQKINGERNLFVMQEGSVSQAIVPLVVSSPIVVDRTDDISPIPAGCDTAVANDCSLRGAVQAANANPGRTINIPAGTYTLTINGTVSTGCEGNSVGDLGINASTTIVGDGAGTTIIRQHGTNVANSGDRVICLNETVANSIVYTISAVTIIGGRDSSTWTAGGIIGGGHLNSLTLNNVVIANNQSSNTGTVNTGGGGIQIVGGPLIINNSTIGGSSAPTTFDVTNGTGNRDSTTAGNLANVSGGGINFDPSSGTVVGTVGNLTVTSTTFNNNRSGSTAAGGGGIDINNAGFGSGGGGSGIMTFDDCTFSNNQATGAGNTGNGGAIVIESLNATINATSGDTSFTSNSATNKGGAIANTGGALTIDGTSANGITFSSNTATVAGSSIFTNNAATLMGTNTTVGGSIYVATNGTWTNSVGSAISPTDFSVMGGTLTCNNSTMNVTGNFTIGKETTKGGVVNAGSGIINIDGNMTADVSFTSVSAGAFNAGSGTVNLKGNLSVVLGTTPNNGTFSASTGTFNFNGTAAQTITNSGTGTPITFNNLTDSNSSAVLTCTNSINVGGTLNVNHASAIFEPGASAIIGGAGTLTGTDLTGTGTARVTRTTATADFLTQYTITNKTLTNLTIDYSGAGNQTVNNTPAYRHLRVSGSGTKTLQGATSITGNLTIAAAALDVSASNFAFNLDGNWTNTVGALGFVARSGTVTFDGTGVVQTLSGNTTFFNLTLNNSSSTTQFGTTTTTIANNLVTSLGSMQADTSTIIFTGAAGSISGAAVKRFNNLQINSGASISNSTGGDTTIFNDYQNNGTFTQAAGLTTTFATGDGIHSLSGSGASTFGVVTINSPEIVNAGSHNFNVVGASFTANGTFNGDTGTVTFNGGVAQAIAGTGTKNFTGLTINNGNGVSVTNVASAVDASVAGALTLTTDLTVASGAILQQSGTSAGAADAIGTVRRTDLGVTERAFGNPNNTITINSGTGPTQMDFNLVKAAPGTFPATVKVVPRDITLTPTGGGVFSATLKLRYIDPGELTGPGITESRLILWKNIAGTWTPQGGTDDAANNFVSLSGVTSFSEWAIAEGSDLTVSKANNVSNAAVVGQQWTWTLTVTNAGGASADFTSGQTILTDNLPNSNVNYGTLVVSDPNINCSIDGSNDLTCTAGVSGASIAEAGSFTVQIPTTATAAGAFANPRGGGNVTVDPGSLIPESNEGNNTAATNTVTVGKANTTTTISNAATLTSTPSVTGQPVTVQWNVTVNAPGSLGAALTGNVTVSDGTNMCVAAVSAGQCDITFTSAGAKSITATYAGDTNYNGSASTPATAHTVNAADTTTTITSDNPDPSNAGQSVDVTYTVVANAPGGGTPTGNVQVSDGVDTNTCTVAAGTCALSLTTTGNRTITATYQGSSDFNMSSDTESHDVVSSTVSVNDAKKAEPTSGTTNMTFTVTLSSPAAGAESVDFTTADEAPGAGKAVAGTCGNPGADYVTTSGTVSFTAGQQVKTISVPVCADTDNAEPDETFLVNLSNPSGVAIADGTATGTITVANPAGAVLISELRTRGTGGAGDDFVEVYNNTDSPLTVTASDASAGYGIFKMGTDCNATPVLIATIPNGTMIPARGHYLIVGSTYSLADYGGTGAAAGNVTMSSDIDDDKNVAVFSTANVTNISSANRLDAVGFGTNTGSVCDLLREGTNQGAVGALNIEDSFFRKLFSGNPQDTNDNSVDFLFADTVATPIAGLTQRLGAPGPENLASPIRRDNAGILLPLLDGTVSSSQAPNRFRNFANVIPTTAPNGTLDIRRRVQNTTGATVTRLRFRIVDITTFPSPGAGTADLRVITSSAVVISGINDPATCAATGTPTTTPCDVTAQVTTLETPPNQPNGGGYNSTLTVAIPGGLANNASIDVNFQLGVVQAGTFRFKIIIEALP